MATTTNNVRQKEGYVATVVDQTFRKEGTKEQDNNFHQTRHHCCDNRVPWTDFETQAKE